MDKPKLVLPYSQMEGLFCETTLEERSAVTLHATICGGGGRASNLPGGMWEPLLVVCIKNRQVRASD